MALNLLLLFMHIKKYCFNLLVVSFVHFLFDGVFYNNIILKKYEQKILISFSKE
jgi:hypothetical protein